MKQHAKDKSKVRDKKEDLRLIYETCMDEYRTLRDEQIQLENTSQQVVQIAIAGAAAIISFSGYIVERNLALMFLIAPWVFYCLAWAYLRLVYLMYAIRDYMINDLVERIRTVVFEQTMIPQDHLLGWESISRKEMHSYKRRLLLVEASGVAIPLFTAAVLPAAYIAYVWHFDVTVSPYAVCYFLIDWILFFYTVRISFWVRRFRLGKLDDPPRKHDLTIYQLWHLKYELRERKKRWFTGPDKIERASWYYDELSPHILGVYRLARLSLCGLILVFTVVAAL